METTDGPKETGIHDLPDDILAKVLSRVGDSPLPLHCPAGTSYDNVAVAHPAQCAFVCARWRNVARDLAVQSLTLGLDHASVPAHGPNSFSSLKALTLASSGLPSFPECLSALEPLAPRLESLHLQVWITRDTLAPVARFLSLCQGVRDLETALTETPLAAPKVVPWLDVVRALPLLSKLRLKYNGGHHTILWARLEAMPNLEELHLTSKAIPPASAGAHLISIVRSIHWLGGSGEAQAKIGHLTSLESLSVSWRPWRSLAVWSDCLPYLSRLVSLELEGLYHLHSLPETLGQLASLEVLALTNCAQFSTLPETVGNLRRLRVLKVDRCSSWLPEVIVGLTNLESLLVNGEIRTLPARIGELRRLSSLRLIACELQELPESTGDLSNLEELEIKYRGWSFPASLLRLTRVVFCKVDLPEIRSLPSGLATWRSLTSLALRCRGLSVLPDSLCEIGALRELRLSCCEELRVLPQGVGRLGALTYLRLWHCPMLRALPAGLGRLSSLEMLSLMHCRRLEELPTTVQELSALRMLVVSDCGRLGKLPEGVWDLPRLEHVHCPPSLKPSRALSADMGLWSSLVGMDRDPYEWDKRQAFELRAFIG